MRVIHKHGFTMNLLLFILFTNVLADSNEDSKYIDLLPDEEKTDFLEKVASKLERDADSEAEEKSGDSDLMDNENEFVESVIRQESSDTRRQANKTDALQKSLETSDLSSKTQSNETVRRIDLTKRSLKNNQKLMQSTQPEYIKVEIVTDEVQVNIVKASNNKNSTITPDLEDSFISSSVYEPVTEIISNNKSKRSNSETETTKFVNPEDLTTTTTYDATSGGNSAEFENQTVISNTEDETTTEPDFEMTDSIKEVTKSNPKQFEENVTSTTVKDEISVSNECAGENCTMRPINYTTAMLEDETTESSKSEEDYDEITTKIIRTKVVDIELTTITNDFEFVGENNKTKRRLKTNVESSTVGSVKNETSSKFDELTTEIIFNVTNEENKQHVVTTNYTPAVNNMTHITNTTTNITKPTLLDKGTEKPILRIGNGIVEKNKKLAGKKKNDFPESFEDIKLDDLASIAGRNTILLIDGEDYNKDENIISASTLNKKPKKVNNKVKTVKKGNRKPPSIKIEVKFPGKPNKKVEKTEKQTYQVYEIAPDQPPFIKKPETLKVSEHPYYVEEQPYYVPVYNYAPIKAYYNPVNRFGPNEAFSNENYNEFDDIEGQFNKDKFFHYDIKNYDDEIREYKKHIKKTKTNDLRYISNELDSLQSDNQPILKLIDDYLDDYYYGRNRNSQKSKSLRRIPVTDKNEGAEDDEKYTNMKNNLREARNILNRQTNFGFIVNPNEINKKIKNLTTNDGTPKPILKINDVRETYKIEKIKSPVKQVSTVLDGIHPLSNIHENDDMVTIKNVPIFTEFQGKGNIKHKKNRKKSNNNDKKVVKIKDILNMTPNTDLLPVLFKLQKMNLTLMRRVEDLNIKAYLNVLRDMMIMENRRLEKFDWLRSTVCIQSKIQKLFAMIRALKLRKDIHPADLEVIKYIMFLYNVVNDVNSDSFGKQLRSLIPKPKNKREIRQNIALKGFANRVWLIRNHPKDMELNLETSNDIKNIEVFLKNVVNNLYGFHTAIKNISKVTSFKHQNWFKNLKELYLSTEEKHLLEVLLHLSASKVCNLLEDSTKSGLEKDFVKYVMTNEHTVRNTSEELIFAIKVMNAMKN